MLLEMEEESNEKAAIRVSKGWLISYVELSFVKAKCDFVKEIWIDSKSKVELQDVMHTPWRYGYYDKVDGFDEKSPILITKSSSSYRLYQSDTKGVAVVRQEAQITRISGE